MGLFRTLRRRSPASERGATLVEYALIVSLMIVTSLGAIKSLERNADEYYDTTSSRIGALPGTDGAAPTGTSIPGASSTTTAVPTTTTTTAPPTTTTTRPPTTTTTAAPTTTSTTTAPRTAITLSTTVTRINSSYWRVVVTATARNTVTNGTVSGAGITMSATLQPNSVNAGSVSCTTNTSGTCSYNSAAAGDVPNQYTSVTFRVTGVTSSPTWNGTQTSVTANRPA